MMHSKKYFLHAMKNDIRNLRLIICCCFYGDNSLRFSQIFKICDEKSAKKNHTKERLHVYACVSLEFCLHQQLTLNGSSLYIVDVEEAS